MKTEAKTSRRMPRAKFVDGARMCIVVTQEEASAGAVKYTHTLVLSIKQAEKLVESVRRELAEAGRPSVA